MWRSNGRYAAAFGCGCESCEPWIDGSIEPTESGCDISSDGDGCDWYDSNPSGCSLYDDSDFDSNEMCCACGGGAFGAGVSGDSVTGPLRVFGTLLEPQEAQRSAFERPEV